VSLNVMPLTEDKKGSFSSTSPASLSATSPLPPIENNDSIDDDNDVDNNNSITSSPYLPTASTHNLLPLLDPSGSIGSLLLQMQKREEALKQLSETINDANWMENQVTNLSPTTPSSNVVNNNEELPYTSTSQQQRIQDDLFSWMLPKQPSNKVDEESANDEGLSSFISMEEAKELDQAVSIRLSSSAKDIVPVSMPELYQAMMVIEDKASLTNTLNATVNQMAPPSSKKRPIIQKTQPNNEKGTDDYLPPLSRKEHYIGHIGRDMRQLAVSIASCVDDVSEWRVFCQQATGGIEPLIQCIRVGAKSIRDEQLGVVGVDNELLSPSFPTIERDSYPLSPTGSISSTTAAVHRTNEEAFELAFSACRALRDLCALSLDLAAVITDGLLRANVAYKRKGRPTLMEDLCTLLRYSDDYSVEPAKSRKHRLVSKLHVIQLLLAMTCASDSAVEAIRVTEGLQDMLLASSSYASKERRRRWMRYPGELVKSMWLSRRNRKSRLLLSRSRRRRPFIEATSLTNDLQGKLQGTANQVLAAIGYNEWVPKIPGQKGLRILCLDGGGSRGMTSVVALKCLVDALDGVEVADCFDLVVGTSTGAIIAFLVGLNRETSEQAVARYEVLIEKIFTKSAFSTPMLLFTTASYDESPFMNVLSDILGDNTMLDSRADPAVPFVFAVTSKMSSTPTHVALFRNYNYNGKELPDPFMIDPDDARQSLGLQLESEADLVAKNEYRPTNKNKVNTTPGSRNPAEGSRNPGSFRVLQRYALRASTAAPTVFKPVMMGGEMYCDGGIVASNPSAIAIHEARNIFPNVPIELVVSIGTGGFLEQKSEPRIGWDGIIGQIVNSATDGEQIHHILQDILGDGGTTRVGRSFVSNTRYMRFNPTLGLPDEFPIDVTDPEKLAQIKTITKSYMNEPEQQQMLQDLADLLQIRTKKKRFRIPKPSHLFR
jgi:predicted acylesterase/phospholipase RssA